MNWPNNELSKLVIINITVDQINEKLLQAILLDILRQQLVGLVALFRGGTFIVPLTCAKKAKEFTTSENSKSPTSGIPVWSFSLSETVMSALRELQGELVHG